MNEGPDIDGSLPGQEMDDEVAEEEIRREGNIESDSSSQSDFDSWDSTGNVRWTSSGKNHI